MWPPAPRGHIRPLYLTGLGFQGVRDSHFQDLFCHQLTARQQTYVADVTGPCSQNTSQTPKEFFREPFQNNKRMHVYNWSLELRCLYPTGVAKSTTGMITLCRVRHKGHSRCILNVTIDSYGVVTFLHPLIVIALPYPKAKRTSTH